MLQCATEPAVVGEAEMRLSLAHGLVRQLIACASPVKGLVLIMDMKMSSEVRHGDLGVERP